MGPFWGPVFDEKTSGKSKSSSKGAEFSWAPQFYSSIVPMVLYDTIVVCSVVSYFWVGSCPSILVLKSYTDPCFSFNMYIIYL